MDYFKKDIIKTSFLPVIREQWLSAEDTFPAFLKEMTDKEKASNENYVQDISTKFSLLVKKCPRFPFIRRRWRNQIDSLLSQVLLSEAIIDLHKYLSPEKIDAFVTEIKDFLREVRSYTPELSFADMGQALRNYIVYMMFKQIHEDNSPFSRTCYGYSMLYPYTDNYIDNPGNSAVNKERYNALIQDFLNKKQHIPTCTYDTKTLHFLSAASTVVDCSDSDTARTLLLLMLDAQAESLKQQKSENPLTLEERLAISLYKGGVSVLIDRYYVAKEMNREDFLFYLGFGFFLQLADDLQDIKEDSKRGGQTLFTISLQEEALEKLVNKLLHFVRNLCFSFYPENTAFLQFVLNSSYQLIAMSLNRSKEYFRTDYVKHMETVFPVSFACLEKSRQSSFGNLDSADQIQYQRVVDAILS
ncbi:MAG: hypothetical protein K0R05_267 [Anaerocolumna sp.]|jgi:hypothetical protein|nr:hypothetical protein [Anaerocolumna sp.]